MIFKLMDLLDYGVGSIFLFALDARKLIVKFVADIKQAYL